MATRWGIISCGSISKDFTTALKSLPQDEHQVAAVAGRSLDSAKEFAERFSIPRSYGSYKELVEDPEIDVVYIGTIHPYHYECCKLVLNGGKSVLCEKPMCMNTKQAKEIIDLAKERKFFFMEGIWTRCFPAYQKLRETLASGTIGEPLILHASFGLNLQHKSRMVDKSLGGGALLDLGLYVVQTADFLFGKPEAISAMGTMHPTDVDATTVITLRYPGNKMAILTCSLLCDLVNKTVIQGSKGIIEFPEPWSPTEITINGERHQFPLPECKLPVIHLHSEGFAYEASHVREMLLKGALESPLMTHESSLNIVAIMDEARRQMGVVYDVDQ